MSLHSSTYGLPADAELGRSPAEIFAQWFRARTEEDPEYPQRTTDAKGNVAVDVLVMAGLEGLTAWARVNDEPVMLADDVRLDPSAPKITTAEWGDAFVNPDAKVAGVQTEDGFLVPRPMAESLGRGGTHATVVVQAQRLLGS